jgi:DNA topoisomerase-2
MLFNKEDNNILEEQYFEGDKIEPKFYLPALPLLLINGSEGIASGFAQKIMNRNPKDILKHLKNVLEDKKSKYDFKPYYNDFAGVIEHGENQNQWIIKGKIERVNSTKIKITEIPIGVELKSYLKTLDTLEEKGFIKSYKDLSEKSFLFELSFQRGVLDNLSDNQLLDKLKLTKTVTENYTAIDAENKVKVFESAEEIFNYYFNIKIQYLQKRIEYIIEKLKKEIKRLVSTYLFIQAITEEKLIINKRKKSEIEQDLEKFDKIHKVDDSYDHLLRLPIYSLTKEKMAELMDKIKDKKQELDYYKSTTPQIEWLKDLDLIKL